MRKDPEAARYDVHVEEFDRAGREVEAPPELQDHRGKLRVQEKPVILEEAKLIT